MIIGRLGEPIFAGLRRVFTEPVGQPAEAALPEEGTGRPGGPDRVARWLRDFGIKIVASGRASTGWVVRTAAERSITPNSVTGISLLVGLCAAAWFSGASQPDAVRGLIATGVWVLSRVGARQLAAMPLQPDRRCQPAGGQPPTGSDRSDWLVLPSLDWTTDVEQLAAAVAPGRDTESQRRFDWLYAVCASAAECAIYGGMAAGAQAAGYTATWPLALAVVVVRSLTVIARAIAPSPAGQRLFRADVRGDDPPHTPHRPHPLRLRPVSIAPVGIRTLLAAVILVGDGPRIALFVVLVIDVVTLVRALVGTGRHRSAIRLEKLRACRDDGPLARRAGALVRGNLMPMPAVVAGLIAVGLLTALGMKNLPGIVALTPVVVLMLAAPGSSHPHDGRVDWLVPVLLCLGQYGYLAALGAARSVPWLLVFTTGGMTAVWYTSLAAMPAGRPRGIGWDGRVCLVGLAGMFGIATFGYLGLTACLGAQICGQAMSDYLRQGEDRHR